MTEAETIKLSVIVPIYNEAANLRELHREIVQMCKAPIGCSVPFDWEILFIDDGSVDETPTICEELHPLRYIRLDGNYGQTAALDCGFKAATGDYIAALDGDGQNDPADIPYMLQYLLDHDLDVVSGWRKDRQDTFQKRLDSRLANLLRQAMVRDGIHDSGCTLKVYRRACFEDLTLYGDQHRFIPALLKNRGFQIGELEVHHRPRQHGKSKYNFTRVFRGMRDLSEIHLERSAPAKTHGLRRTLINGYYKRMSRTTYSVAGIEERKSIALIVNTLSSGGAEHVAANLSRELSKNYDVDIILNDDKNIEYAYSGTIQSLGLPADADRSSRQYQLKALAQRTKRLRELKRTRRYIAAISFSDNTNLSNVLSKVKGCKTIISIRNSLAGMEETYGTHFVLNRRVLDICCKAADLVVSCSMEIADDLIAHHGLNPAKAKVIYNGVDLDLVEEALASSPHKDSERKRILTMGRMTRQKGQWHLLRVLKALRERGQDVELVILGDGPLRAKLEAMCADLDIQDYVQMPGRVSDPYPYLATADVAVFPSLFEGFSNAILEALACGVPCISTDHKTGARELLAPDTDYRIKNFDHVEYARYGILVPVSMLPIGDCLEDAEKPLTAEENTLVKAIETVLTDQERNKHYREAGPARARKLDLLIIVKQWIKLIEEP